MKQCLIILVSIFIVNCANAQKNFQGEITYRLHASGQAKPDAELKILFGVNRLKLRFKEREDYDKEDLLVIFDSAATFMLNKETKTYTKRALKIGAPPLQLQKKSINGYAASPVVQEENGLSVLLGGMLGASNTVFYVADSLYYTVPATLIGNTELVAIQKNKIVLSAEITLSSRYNETEDSSGANKNNLVTAEAIEIKPMVFSDAEFTIPADYVYGKNIEHELPMSDTDAIKVPVEDYVIDTFVVAPPKQKPAKQPVKKSTKPKTAPKSSALKPKQ